MNSVFKNKQVILKTSRHTSVLSALTLLAFLLAGPAYARDETTQTAVLASSSGKNSGKSDAVIASGLRFGEYKDHTRIVIDLTEKPAYRIFRLDNPDRIVVDLDHVFWDDVMPNGSGGGLVRSYNRQSVSAERTRLVLTTKGMAAVAQVFDIPARDGRLPRLVIDLGQASNRPMQADPVLADTINTGRNPRIGITRPAPKPLLTAHTETSETTLSAPMSAALVSPAPLPPPKPHRWRVVLDAGHGGVDPGAHAVDGHDEKNLTLRVARKVRAELQRRGLYQVVLTRDEDRFIPLRERVTIARDSQAEFFISFHADSSPDRDVRGASIYTLSEKASDNEAERLAGQENLADAIGGVNLGHENTDVANILIDLAMRETMNQSRKAAGILVDSFGTQDIRLVRNGHRSAGFAVLKAADVPSLLIEMGYLSNPADAALLHDDRYIDRLVIAVADGIDAYFKRHEVAPQPVQQASNP